MEKIRVVSEDLEHLRDEVMSLIAEMKNECSVIFESIKGIDSGLYCAHSVKVKQRALKINEDLLRKMKCLEEQVEVLEEIVRDYESTERENIDAILAIG